MVNLFLIFGLTPGHTAVKRYSETSLYQEQINDGEFYCRRLRYDPERNEFSVGVFSVLLLADLLTN